MEPKANERSIGDQAKDKIEAALEKQGVLGELKAQVRASVYWAAQGEGEQPLVKRDSVERRQKFASREEGRIALGLVADLLASLDMKHAWWVAQPESCVEGSVPEREALTWALNLEGADVKGDEPLLGALIRQARQHDNEQQRRKQEVVEYTSASQMFTSSPSMAERASLEDDKAPGGEGILGKGKEEEEDEDEGEKSEATDSEHDSQEEGGKANDEKDEEELLEVELDEGELDDLANLEVPDAPGVQESDEESYGAIEDETCIAEGIGDHLEYTDREGPMPPDVDVVVHL